MPTNLQGNGRRRSRGAVKQNKMLLLLLVPFVGSVVITIEMISSLSTSKGYHCCQHRPSPPLPSRPLPLLPPCRPMLMEANPRRPKNHAPYAAPSALKMIRGSFLIGGERFWRSDISIPWSVIGREMSDLQNLSPPIQKEPRIIVRADGAA